MSWKSILLAVALSTIVMFVLGALAWFLIISPKETGYLAEYSQKEKNVRGEIGGLRGTIASLEAQVTAVDERSKDKLTYEVAYGLRTNEWRLDIPTYFRSLQIRYETDADGAITKIDTTGRWETFVPPIPGWRNWQELKKKLGYVPRQLASVDTSSSGEEGEGKYFWVGYRFEPTFEQITEERLLASIGKLGNKILEDKRAEAGKVETTGASGGEKMIEAEEKEVPAVESEKKQPPVMAPKKKTIF